MVIAATTHPPTATPRDTHRAFVVYELSSTPCWAILCALCQFNKAPQGEGHRVRPEQCGIGETDVGGGEGMSSS